MLEAFARRPEWSVVTVSCAGEEVAPEVRNTLLHWGEYERICWGAVHQGGLPLLGACSVRLVYVRLSGPARQSRAASIFAQASANQRGALPVGTRKLTVWL